MRLGSGEKMKISSKTSNIGLVTGAVFGIFLDVLLFKNIFVVDSFFPKSFIEYLAIFVLSAFAGGFIELAWRSWNE
jgi:hypothetical protein